MKNSRPRVMSHAFLCEWCHRCQSERPVVSSFRTVSHQTNYLIHRASTKYNVGRTPTMQYNRLRGSANRCLRGGNKTNNPPNLLYCEEETNDPSKCHCLAREIVIPSYVYWSFNSGRTYYYLQSMITARSVCCEVPLLLGQAL
jgi:hypothetical protein